MPQLAAEVAWPLTLVLAWAMGELAQRLARVPRISTYAVVGFLLSLPAVGVLPSVPSSGILLLAHIAFGLVLFESGYRIHLRWFRANPWIVATSLVESLLTFWAVLALVRWQGIPMESARLIAALSMATSPATVVRVVNELRSSGQVTERVLHLSALNCALAVLVFKVIVGMSPIAPGGTILVAAQEVVLVLLGSVLTGILMGALVPAVLRAVRRTGQDSTLAYALAVILLASINHALALSPVLATLTLGIVSRNRRVFLTPSERGFGVLGAMLSVLLFTFVAVTVEWHQLRSGLGLGLALILVRQLAKVSGSTLFAFLSGTSWRKGALTGVALAPMSAIVILVLEETRSLGVSLFNELAPLAAAALLLEIVGPILVGRALRFAHEVNDGEGT